VFFSTSNSLETRFFEGFVGFVRSGPDLNVSRVTTLPPLTRAMFTPPLRNFASVFSLTRAS